MTGLRNDYLEEKFGRWCECYLIGNMLTIFLKRVTQKLIE